MSTLVPNIAPDINRHHALACAKADEAVSHAVQAGKLLLQAKASMRHGQFAPWLAANVVVTARQAQRYMATAQGKSTPIRAPKTTPVSHLSGRQAGSGPSRAITQGEFVPDTLSKWVSNPAFRPAPGYWHCASDAGGAYWVVPSLQYPACFHISRFTRKDDDGEGYFDGTRQPVAGFLVERSLQALGLANPIALQWTSVQKQGLDGPFGEPEVAAAVGV